MTGRNTATLERMEQRLQIFVRHPYFTLAMLCVALIASTNQTAARLLTTEGMLFAGLLLMLAYLAFCARPSARQAPLRAVVGGALLAALFYGIYRLSGTVHTAAWLMGLTLAVLAAIAIYLLATHQMTTGRAALLLAAGGFILRLGYVLYTSIYTRQHDIGQLGQAGGHLGYIEYLWTYRWFPQSNPKNLWQYYHPPLHHAIAAMVMGGLRKLGMTDWRAAESLQFLTLFYSSSLLVVSWKIFREMGLKKGGLLAAFAFVCFFPALLVLSGSLNNDMLSILLLSCAILYTIRWYKKPTMRNITGVALAIGLGMMTKMSVALVAPAVAWVFLMRLIGTSSRERKRLWGQFALFALICIPLGLWWGVRNWINYQIPLTYVPDLGRKSGQYVGRYPIKSRLLDFSAYQFRQIFMAWGSPYLDFNIWVCLLKTAMFDEQNFLDIQPLIRQPAMLLLYTGVVVAGISALAALRGIFRRDETLDKGLRGFWIILPVTLLASYIQFCFQYPQTCSANMRYTMPLVLVAAFFLGNLWQDRWGNHPKLARAVRWGVTALLSVFFALSASVYIMLGTA